MRERILSIFVISLCLFFVTGFTFGASSNIQGHVRDAQTGDPLPGANVILVGTSLGSATDAGGKYLISNVPPGKYTLKVSYIGYDSKELSIELKVGGTLEQDFKLNAVGVEGQTVVVTAQASGQSAAINQQLSAMSVKNVVSAAKIQALPDANAAESVGRLPGVSLVRQGGEASQVVVRGLAPQYNQVTIDGVELPSDVLSSNDIESTDAGAQAATGGLLGDRGVDLSMISSNMLAGIEVIKAITPDMDADVLGGVVNFDMPRAPGIAGLNDWIPRFTLLSQGEYNQLKSTANNYKFSGTLEKRFDNNNFGVLVQASAEKRNLSDNSLGAGYSLVDKSHGDAGIPDLNDLTLTDTYRIRKRYNGTVVLDYKSGNTSIGLMNVFSNSDTKETQRQETAYIKSPNAQLRYRIIGNETKLNIISNLLHIEQDIPFFHASLRLSHAYSENNSPTNTTFDFLQNYGWPGITTNQLVKLQPKAMAKYIVPDSGSAYLTNITNPSTYSKTRTYTASLDLQHDFTVSDYVTAKLKFGGFYQYKKRSQDKNESSGSTIYDGGDAIVRDFQKAYPWLRDNSGGLSLANFVYNGYDYGTFLNGDYSLAYPLNADLMWQLIPIALANRPSTVIGTGYQQNQVATKLNDYSGHEVKDAAYLMTTVNIGGDITVLPGVRYQNLTTTYTGTRGVLTSSGLQPPVGGYDTTVTKSHGYFLPMVHLIYKPFNWLNLHFAYTNTLNYQDFSTITPRYLVGTSFIDYNNYDIKPARSENFDLVASVFTNEIGLLSIDGFSKRITDLVFYSQVYMNPKDVKAAYPQLPISSNSTYQFDTYINNPFAVNDYGVEAEWQTHLWYLPGILSGLVFDVNYTHIFSKAKYPKSEKNATYDALGNPVITIVDTFYTDRLPLQPDDIVNLSLGYDYSGFSIRVSMLYHSNVFQSPSFWLQERVTSAKFTRWDLSAKQDLPWYGLQLFLNVGNLNSEDDININEKTSFPASEERYGTTVDLGLRMTL